MPKIINTRSSEWIPFCQKIAEIRDITKTQYYYRKPLYDECPSEDRYMLAHRQVETSTNLIICSGCLNIMESRDILHHPERACHKLPYTEQRFCRLYLDCFNNAINTTLYTLYILKRILNKDLAKMIGIMIYNTRHDIILWRKKYISQKRKKIFIKKLSKHYLLECIKQDIKILK